MKRFYNMCIIVFCCITAFILPKSGMAQDVFPEFSPSSTTIHLPINIIQGYHADPDHEVNGYVVYTVHGQFFPQPSKGHVQTLPEGFSGVSDRESPWKTLTELLAAYHSADLAAIKSLYTPDSQDELDVLFSDPDTQERLTSFMEAISGMDIWLGFDFRGGFLAFVNLHYQNSQSDLMPYYFVKSGAEYLLSAITVPTDETLDVNIILFLQQGHSVADLLKPPDEQHALTVEKSGTGDGTVTGSGIDCGPDCIEVYQEGVVVFLKAEPNADSVFEGWLVDGNPPEGRIEMTKDITVTAIFTGKE